MRLFFWRKPSAPPAPPTGPYAGRLAFDSDSGFHIDPDGNPVVTDDAGKTWRYAVAGDLSHQARYHERVADVAATTDADPHHEFPTADDPHYSEGATDPQTGKVTHTRLVNSPDSAAVLETSHTEAYA